MGSTGAGTGRGGGRAAGGRTERGTEVTVNYRGGAPITYRQTGRGVVAVGEGGRTTRTGIRDLSEVRRNARRSGNRTRTTRRPS